MTINRCPGMDRRFWRIEDIFETPCPHCGAAIEMWKDDPQRTCGSCGKTAANPKLDLGCAEWCDFAAECLGAAPYGRAGTRRHHEGQEGKTRWKSERA